MSDIGARIAALSPERQALLAMRLRSSGSDATPRREPLAIVGIGCRFPGGADTPGRFWRLLRDGVDAITPVPPERWDAEALYAEDPQTPGKMSTRWGGFLPGLDRFEPSFFGISPRETASLDPQQRLFLEVSSEALEDAGQTPARLAGSRTGVYVGTHTNDYSWMLFADATRPRRLRQHGHVAQYRGQPAVVRARPPRSQRGRGHGLLVVAGRGPPGLSGIAKSRVRSGARRRREPPAVAALERGALQARHAVPRRALQDLRRAGQRHRTQRRLRRDRHQAARRRRRRRRPRLGGDPRIGRQPGRSHQRSHRAERTRPAGGGPPGARRRRRRAGEIGLVETHGTGTPLGDPIEVEALAAVLGAAGEQPCLLGSVKTNIGHLEAAAGIAGLIKVVLSLQHEAVPGLVHFRELNPHIDLTGTRFVIPRTLQPWPRGQARRCGGVSAFGFGGTNAHIVIEEAPPVAPVADRRGRRTHLLALSARGDDGLRSLARAYQEQLQDGAQTLDLDDLCASAAMRRIHYPHRVAVVGASRDELLAQLAATAEPDASLPAATAAAGPAFVFSGQGAQWPGMGRELLEHEPVFRRVIEACDERVRAEAGWSVLDLLRAGEDEARLRATEFAQPAIFALQVGLAELLKSWGVRARRGDRPQRRRDRRRPRGGCALARRRDTSRCPPRASHAAGGGPGADGLGGAARGRGAARHRGRK